MDGEVIEMKGYAYSEDASKPGQLKVHLEGVPVDGPYWVLALGDEDGVSYLIVEELTVFFCLVNVYFLRHRISIASTIDTSTPRCVVRGQSLSTMRVACLRNSGRRWLLRLKTV